MLSRCGKISTGISGPHGVCETCIFDAFPVATSPWFVMPPPPPDSTVPQPLPPDEGWGSTTPFGWTNGVGLGGGIVVFVLLLLLPTPDGLSEAGWHTAALGLLMAIWWMTEAIPMAATALLPIVLLPLLGAQPIREATAPYANPLIFLFLGGFVIALGMERWNLHRRIALNVIRAIGTKPRAIVLGFMVSAAGLSMWVSNTATAVMMLPIGLSVLQLARSSSDGGAHNFGPALMLSIAYGCSLGGIATLIGTPTNAVLAGFFFETYNVEIGFAQWMLLGVPLLVIGLPLTFWVLTRWVFPIRIETLPGGKALILDALKQLGKTTKPEWLVMGVFGMVAVLWIVRPLLTDMVPGLSDAGIAIGGALLMFLVPVDLRQGQFLLTWREAERLPWGVLLLFGGGLSLASAISETGLADWIGNALAGLSALPIVLIVLIVVAIVVLLTEMTSNVATAAAFLPIMASVAIGIGQHPFVLTVPVVIAASCAFMLPVATPPNAIVYGSGAVTIQQMVRAGWVLNILFILLTTALALTLGLWVFEVEFGVLPAWVQP